ncbi:hypothetical protein KA107_03230 [Candidatus Pacearchaeota archaeon]|nr:hypothetical protein [Candidatus Pacearchaeota archaeon]
MENLQTLSAKDLIKLVEETSAKYTGRDKNYFLAWRNGLGSMFEQALARKNWEEFQDYLDLGDYSVQSKSSSWAPESFGDQARWVLYGGGIPNMLVPAILGQKRQVLEIKEIDRAIHSHRCDIWFPKILVGSLETSLHFSLDYDSMEQNDGGYEIEDYYFTVSRNNRK